MDMGATDAEIIPSLVAQAATGDELAFARVVAAYHDDMVRVAFVVCRDRELAQEATQRSWDIAWRKLSGVRDAERLRPWLMAVAANEARGLLRHHGRRAIRELSFDPASVDGFVSLAGADPADQILRVDLANALARLRPDDRAIVGMRYAVGLSAAEIGTAIGMSDRGVRARLARLLALLRKDLGDG
jgi:RNA polymerase sigma factor (sigma-70 family)